MPPPSAATKAETGDARSHPPPNNQSTPDQTTTKQRTTPVGRFVTNHASTKETTTTTAASNRCHHRPKPPTATCKKKPSPNETPSPETTIHINSSAPTDLQSSQLRSPNNQQKPTNSPTRYQPPTISSHQSQTAVHARARPPDKTEQQNGPLKESNRSTRPQPQGRDIHLPLGQTEKRPRVEIGGRPRNPASCRRHCTYPLRTGIPRKETGGQIARTGREPEKARTKTGTGQKQTERRKGQGKKGSGKGKSIRSVARDRFCWSFTNNSVSGNYED